MATQRTALKESVRRLKEGGIDMPVLDARLLVEYALGVDWAALFTGPDRDLTPAESETLEILLQRRLAREPIARIVGKRGFWKLDLAISPATLDPRPDTETLITTVLKLVPDMAAPLSILDLGTGSGAILLALLNEFTHATGTGIDISEEAIATAAANALHYGMQHRADFLTGDWNDAAFVQILTGPFDIVASNPPYIRSGDIPALAPEVREHDPLAALDGGQDGLDAYRSLARLLPSLIKPDGLLVVEIGMGQADDVERIFAAIGFGGFRRWPDLSGIARVISAKPIPS